MQNWKIGLQAGLFLLISSGQALAQNATASNETVSRQAFEDLRAHFEAFKKEQSALAPRIVETVSTGVMTIGSALLVPYACVPTKNNPELDNIRITACIGSATYLLGQAATWINQLVAFRN